MKRGDLGLVASQIRNVDSGQQMGDLVLLINSFPSPLPLHTPSLDFIFKSKVLTPGGEAIISTAKPWENAASGQSTYAQPTRGLQALSSARLGTTGGRVCQPALSPPQPHPASRVGG